MNVTSFNISSMILFFIGSIIIYSSNIYLIINKSSIVTICASNIVSIFSINIGVILIQLELYKKNNLLNNIKYQINDNILI